MNNKIDHVIRQAQQEVVQINELVAKIAVARDRGHFSLDDVAEVANLTTECVISLTAAIYLLSERLRQHLNSGPQDHPELVK
jgi:hypothetical protein